jgi:hypothetical protein
MKQVFISHRTDDAFTAAVRTKLVDRLRGTKDVEPLYDRDIEPGAGWRSRILNWLRTCDAAVLLFSRKALEDSKWVPFETAVLSWRHAVTDRPRLVPVLLPGVDEKDGGFDTFEPAQLKEIQFIRLDDPCDTSDAAAERLVEKILKALAPALAAGPPGQDRGEYARWMRQVARSLNEFEEDELEEVARGLGVADADWGAVRGEKKERGAYLAWQLLHADDLVAMRDALTPLRSNAAKRAALGDLVRELAPLWVDQNSARLLRGVTRRTPPDLRNVGLRILGEFEPAELEQILDHYLVRSTCCNDEGRAERFRAPDRCAGDDQFRTEFELRLLGWAMPAYTPVPGTKRYEQYLQMSYDEYASRKGGDLFVLFTGEALYPGPLGWCRSKLAASTFFLYDSGKGEFPWAREGKLRELPALLQEDAAGRRYAHSLHLEGLARGKGA